MFKKFSKMILVPGEVRGDRIFLTVLRVASLLCLGMAIFIAYQMIWVAV